MTVPAQFCARSFTVLHAVVGGTAPEPGFIAMEKSVTSNFQVEHDTIHSENSYQTYCTVAEKTNKNPKIHAREIS
jgi:hypothetical protein